LTTHWKPNIKIRLKLLFSLFLAIKKLRNRIIFEILILISLFGEISPVNFKKKRATAGGVSSLVVATQRSCHPLFRDGSSTTTTTTNSHVSHDAIGTVARHLSTNKTLTPTFIHVSLPRRSRSSSSNIHSCLPSHDVIGSLSRTLSRHSCCRQRHESNRSSDTEDLFKKFSLSFFLAYVWPGPLVVGVMYLLIADKSRPWILYIK
jgi:hypothetical protein